MTVTQPFRAGRLPGEAAAAADSRAREFLDSAVLLADVSEFQPDVVDAAYLRWSQAIIFRGLYGTTIDKAWYGGARRDALHAGGARFVGVYAYIVAGEDIAAQAHALVSLLGTLRPGEKIVADIEEGAGSQQARWVAWADAVNAALHDPPWDYSGANFAAAAGLQPVTWVAAYGSTEPSAPHQLWQFTDAYAVPGVGTCDCSVYHGTISQLAALAYQGSTPVPPAPPVLQQGMTGAAVKTLQAKLNAHGAHLTADGVFGPATKSALERFQSANGLTADGICGPLTWAKLG